MLITNSTAQLSNVTSTTLSPQASFHLPQEAGYIACVAAAILFGSNYIPVKKYETGDGLFFQWILSIAVWISGLILHAIRGYPRFWPTAMLGGFFCATANLMIIPIIHSIGMAMGLLIWGMTDLLMGWASGRFGWFGITAEMPPYTAYNYIGVAFCCCSAVVTAFIRPHIKNVESQLKMGPIASHDEELEPLINRSISTCTSCEMSCDHLSLIQDSVKTTPSYDSVMSSIESSTCSFDNQIQGASASFSTLQQGFMERLPRWAPKALGIAMSVAAGSLDGIMYVPATYVKENFPERYGYQRCTETPCIKDVSNHDVDYIFAQFSGGLLSSTAYFIIYCIVMKNKPRVYPESIVPSLISGFMWGIGMISFFIANEVLSEAISFPIINVGPGLVASLWGVLWFREIRGKRNMSLLVLCFVLIAIGCTFIVLSKIE